MTAIPLPLTHELLGKQLLSGRGLGAQLYVSLRGAVVIDTALGECGPNRPLSPSTLHNTWCSTKPVLTLGLAILLQQHDMSLTTSVGSVLDDTEGHLAEQDCAGLMNHSAGLVQPSAYEAQYMRLSTRLDRTLTLCREQAEAPGPAYSEYAASCVMAAVIERLSRRPARAYLQETVLVPLGLEHDIILGSDHWSFRQLEPRIGAYVWGLPRSPRFALTDRLFHQGGLDRVAAGGLTSSSGLGRFYDHLGLVLACHAGPSGPVSADLLHGLLEARRGPAADPVVGRRCDFAAGFAVGLVDHGFGSCPSDDAFGHGGPFGCSSAFHDPHHGLSVAVFWNGADLGTQQVDAARCEVIGAIYEDLGLRAES